MNRFSFGQLCKFYSKILWRPITPRITGKTAENCSKIYSDTTRGFVRVNAFVIVNIYLQKRNRNGTGQGREAIRYRTIITRALILPKIFSTLSGVGCAPLWRARSQTRASPRLVHEFYRFLKILWHNFLKICQNSNRRQNIKFACSPNRRPQSNCQTQNQMWMSLKLNSPLLSAQAISDQPSNDLLPY